jgi:hypothetical protein
VFRFHLARGRCAEVGCRAHVRDAGLQQAALKCFFIDVLFGEFYLK